MMKDISSEVHLSVVIPVYCCGRSLSELAQRLHATLGEVSSDYEVIMVNDGSPDEAWPVICQLASQDDRVKGLSLSRNFGQHYAITAGLDIARGDWVVVMDCDLQDIPEEIPKLYNAALSGFDIVVGRRAERKDTWIKKLASKGFYRAFIFFTDTSVNSQISNFGIYSCKVIDSIRRFSEQSRSFGLLAVWVGFRRTEIDVQHAARHYGQSSYTFHKMVNLAIDSVVSHSSKLLRLTIKLGLLLCAVSLGLAGIIVARYLLYGTAIIGWTSLIVSIYFTAGLIIGCLGILGMYIGKIFDEVKQRPLYIVKETTFRP